MSLMSHLQQALRLSRWKVSLENGGKCARIDIPSIGLNFFNRKGNISAPQVTSMLSEARILAYHYTMPETNSAFIEYDRLTADRFTFVASSKSWFARDLLKTEVAPSLAVHIELGHVGKASLNSRAQLIDKITGKVFAENINQVVSVSKETRKPTALPDWWVDKYSDHAVGLGKIIIPPNKLPENTYQHKINVPWGNTDAYGHTNYVAYIRFCYDAAQDAIYNSALEGFHEDICGYETKEIQMSYISECKANDTLVISLWKDAENAYKLYFDIAKEAKTIFQSSIEFHGPRT